jgi:hypothetical protein
VQELQAFAQDHGQPAYRGKQLYDGLMHGARSLDDITNARASPPNSLSTAGRPCLASAWTSTITCQQAFKALLQSS